MFLFKLTLPLLGTATLGAVGTGIYYGVESWRNNGGGKTKQARENEKQDKTQEAVSQQKESPIASPADAEFPLETTSSQVSQPSLESPASNSSPQTPTVEVVEEVLPPDK